MADENLEQTKNAEEQPQAPSKEEQGKETLEQEQVTSGKGEDEAARIKAEYEQRLAGLQAEKDKQYEALRQSYFNTQAEQRKAARKLEDVERQLNKKDTRLKETEERLAETYDNPDEYRKALAETRRIEQEREKLEEERNEFEQKQYDQWAQTMAQRARQLNAEYNVPLDKLAEASDEKELELIAYRYALEASKNPEKETEKKESKEKTPPAFDSGVSSSTPKGRSYTRREIAEMSPDEYKKNKAEIESAFRAGKIK